MSNEETYGTIQAPVYSAGFEPAYPGDDLSEMGAEWLASYSESLQQELDTFGAARTVVSRTMGDLYKTGQNDVAGIVQGLVNILHDSVDAALAEKRRVGIACQVWLEANRPEAIPSDPDAWDSQAAVEAVVRIVKEQNA